MPTRHLPRTWSRPRPTRSNVGTIGTAVGWANVSTNANPANIGGAAPNTIVFDQAGVFATPQTITVTGGPLALTNTITPEAVLGPVSGGLTIERRQLRPACSRSPAA